MPKKLILFLILLLAFSESSNAICNLSPIALIRCIPAVSNENPTAAPSDGCCDAVRALSSSDFQCLCDYKNTHPGDLQQYGVDPARAAALPAACGAQNAITCT